MRSPFAGLALLVVVLGCSSSSSKADCDKVAEEIRLAAIKRGYDGDGDGTPDAKGVCQSKDPAVQRDFANACRTLNDCN